MGALLPWEPNCSDCELVRRNTVSPEGSLAGTSCMGAETVCIPVTLPPDVTPLLPNTQTLEPGRVLSWVPEGTAAGMGWMEGGLAPAMANCMPWLAGE
jgi:hypothetical protein